MYYIRKPGVIRSLVILMGMFAVCFVSGLSSCSNSYLGQLAVGHFKIVHASKPIKKVIESGEIDQLTVNCLELVLEIREFAVRELALPDNKSFTVYSELSGQYPGWNVYAAPPFSLEPKTWCYPIAGCVVYHGFFDKTKAFNYAGKIEMKGYDVHVSPFTAYSTLGWFKDPILSNHLKYDSIQLAALIIHELAHQRFYYPDDSRVSESFAVTVERAGVLKWLKSIGSNEQVKIAELRWENEDRYVNDVLSYKKQLDSLYSSDLELVMMQSAKDSILDMAAMELKTDSKKLNNAYFIPFNTYHSLVPRFMNYLDSCSGNFAEFYALIEELYH